MVSKKQEEILNYIDKTIKSNGYSPTVREICEAVGLKSTSTVQYHHCFFEPLDLYLLFRML